MSTLVTDVATHLTCGLACAGPLPPSLPPGNGAGILMQDIACLHAEVVLATTPDDV